VDDFTRPVVTATRTSFPTARAATRHMIPRGRGVVLAFGGEGDPLRDHDIGGLQVAFHAIEAMRRQLATGLGRHGSAW
jgi:3-oxoacyl-[acyl-carrier protein] reductase